MPPRVVCISSLDGAGGEEVGRLVADRLGVPVFDEEIIVRAAREAGVASRVVADAEQRKSLVTRLFHEVRAGSAASAPALGAFHGVSHDFLVDESDDFRGLIRTAIEETAEEGNCVIVAHAASVALSGRAGVLRVLVTASPDTRSDRVARTNRINEREAAKLVGQGDAARAAYLKRFYRVQAELPTLYDLVLNTDRLSPEQAARLITEAATDTPGSDRE